MQRYVSLDVCDYTNTPLCNLYDSFNDLSGQAVNIVVHTERNGYKEIRFTLPSKCFDDEGEKDNYRLDFLISDYRLRYKKRNKDGEMETDWFLISEDKVEHNKFAKTYEVTAKHISYLLKTKNLDLEFSDDEGNNVGTIQQIAECILEGTGWHIGTGTKSFYEDKKYSTDTTKEKVRSFTASSGTGAFKMMTDLCELFDAKPVYHGEGKYVNDQGEIVVGRTVDILPMNPFSEDLEEGAIPKEVLEGEGVLELHYDKSIKSLARTLNTENIVTKLAAYGSYGDRNGLCSLQEAKHAVLLLDPVESDKEYKFTYLDSTYYFTATTNTDSLKFSYLDFVSRSYVYDGTNLYELYKESKTNNAINLNYTETIEKNYFPFIMDFSYYRKVGLLNDDMLKALAEFQKTLPERYIAIQEASADISSALNELTNNSGTSSGYAKLDILSSNIINNEVVLTLDKTEYTDGIIYRSDYTESKRNSFGWYTATGLKENGTAIAGKGSVIYVIHNTNPVSWDKIYVKAYGDNTDNYYRDEIGNTYTLHNKEYYESYESLVLHTGSEGIIYIVNDTKKMYVWFNNGYQEIRAADYNPGENKFDEPTRITLWTSSNPWTSGDQVFLFSADDVAGLFGPREDSIISNQEALQETVKQGSTEIHPIYFIKDSDPIPDVTIGQNGYAWYYRSHTNSFNLGELYFCWGNEGELGWSQVYIYTSTENPERLTPDGNYNYCYSVLRKMLYHLESGKWVPVKDSVNKDRMTSYFASILLSCYRQEYLTNGVKEQYYYTFTTNPLPQGNYAFKNEYNNYWLFSTDRNINSSTGQLRYYTKDRTVWQDEDANHLLKAKEYSFDTLEFCEENIIYGRTYTDGDFVNEAVVREGSKKVTAPVYVHSNVEYQSSLPSGTIIVFNDSNNKVLSYTTNQNFTTPNHTSNLALICPTIPTSSHYLRVKDYTNTLFQKDTKYTILPWNSSGERLGIYYLMNQFLNLSQEIFTVKLPALKEAQNYVTTKTNDLAELLGDMYREGKWTETKYVEGDEDKLYSDSLDNLKEVSHPEATYEFTYIDLYGADEDFVDEDLNNVNWPNVDISYAAHLVDTDLDTNCWAYIDTVDECLDKQWETKIEINTKLSMIGQQSFTDILTKIAEVANETKANQSIYKRAAVLTGSGLLAAERLEGAINANRLLITGGSSNWHTDEKGNIIFEAEDGSAAMMLTGQGWAISNQRNADGDWDWRYAATGLGITADAIYTGYLSAERLEAGSITTDKLSASLGQELDISSNVALNLFATIDGSKPAGGLETYHPNATDSWIKIKAQDGSSPAYIDIQSGGKLNLYGSTVNIESQSSMIVKSGGIIDIQANSEFLVNSPNFKIYKSNGSYVVEMSGKVVATSGEIAGLTIGKSNNISYMYAGSTTSIDSTANGIYLGTNGINLGGKFKVTTAGALTATDANITGTISTSAGNIGSFTIDTALYTNNKSTIDKNVDGVYIGSDGISLGSRVSSTVIRSKFKVTNAGKVYASDADISGKITSYDGTIGGWTIGQTTLTGNKVGLAKTTNDTDIAIWAGNATASSGKFKVTQGGTVTATDADIKGSIKATSLYIGATSSSNGTQMALDSNGFIVSSGTTVDASKIKTIAGIKVDTSGVVISTSTSNVSSAVRSAASISVSNNGIAISSGTNIENAIKTDANITVNASTGVIMSSASGDQTAATSTINKISALILSGSKIDPSSLTAAANNAITKAANISVTNGRINLSSLSTEVVNSSGLSTTLANYATIDIVPTKISALTFDSFGNSSNVQIAPTGITVGSSGTVDFSAAKSISLKAGSISMAAISDYTPVDISGKYDKVSGITIDTSGVAISGNKYIKLDVDGNNYVHLTSSGIDMKGNRVTITDSNNETVSMWARDDIVVMNPNDTTSWRHDVASIESHMSGKHDWVLIRPYYDYNVQYTGPSMCIFEKDMELTRDDHQTFGNEATGYRYTITVVIQHTGGTTKPNLYFHLYAQKGTSSRVISLSTYTASSSYVKTSTETGYEMWTTADVATIDGALATYTITFTAKQAGSLYNLAEEGYVMHAKIKETHSLGSPNFVSVSMVASCDGTSERVPCTVYYYK